MMPFEKGIGSDEDFKVFNDSVHGHMQMHPLCVKIIDTPEFQRLRNIKQVGATYLVYPGASHNRFEHCLGVCYLAGEMVDALKKNQSSLKINATDKLCVQIAGLCHDLGHGPFSHFWESFLQQKGIKWHHEDNSVMMFNYLIEKNHLVDDFEKYGLDELKRKFITELILGEGNSCEEGKQFLFQIVCNKTNNIDVDKWDYLLRDGLHLNLKVGFSYQRLLKFCKVIEREECGMKTLHIGFRSKEAYSIYEMFLVRSSLHYKAYQHRVSLVINQMFVDALLAADDYYFIKGDGNTEIRLSQAHENPLVWTKLTDNIFYDILWSHLNELAPAKEILNRVLTRNLYKCVTSHNVVPSIFNENVNTNWMNNLKSGLEEELNTEIKSGKRFAVLFSNFYLGSNDSDPFRHVYFYDKNDPGKAEGIDLKKITLFHTGQEPAHHLEIYVFDKSQKPGSMELEEVISSFEKFIKSFMHGGVHSGF